MVVGGGQDRFATAPVLIFQMGKVGSKSVQTLLESLQGLTVHHLHHLHPSTIDAVRESCRRAGKPVPPHLRNSELVRARFIDPRRPVRVITMVREPVARNVSAYFQNLDLFHGAEPPAAADLDLVVRRFLEQYPHDVPLTWFDLQMGPALDLDVYQTPFPHEAGWTVLEHEWARVLVLRCEEDDQRKAEAIGRFLGMEGLRLRPENVGAAKAYGDLYQRVRRVLRLPADLIDRMYQSRYARHFYAPAEIEGFRSRWLTGVPAPA
jgi:hypothetical protein